ncbi:MAG: ATP-binding protein [Acidobacteriota bacterium]
MNGPKPRLGLALLLPTTLGIAIIGTLTWVGMTALLRQSATDHLAATLPVVTDLLQPELDRPSDALQELVRSVVPDEYRRLTVIEADGVVVADSSRSFEELGAMDNHGRRPEVAEAFTSGAGTSIRRSPTLDEEMVYAAARRTTPEGRSVVVRLAEPLRELSVLREQLPLLMLVSIAAALMATGFVGLWFHRDLFSPLAELARLAEEATLSRKVPRLEVPRAPEAAALTLAFNRLAERAEEKVSELEAERSSLEAILTSLSDGVVVIDEEGSILRSNPAAAKMFGWSEDPRGAELGSFLPEREGHVVASQTLVDRKPVQLEFEIESTGHTVALVCAPLADGAVLTARDLTEAQHLGQVRRDLVANVSHELKTPLTAIRGYAETLADGAVDDPEIRDRFIGRILQQCRRLQALLTDLLKLSWLEDKSSVEELETVDMGELVTDALEVVLPSAAERSVSIETNIQSASLESSSRETIAELCLNLLDNGIKYNREGGVLSVSLETLEETDEVKFTVRDSGQGIPESSLHRIFERFYRVDRGRGRAEGGTGLGLAIVKHAVERHGGFIEVSSELGRGTTFEVFLPRAGRQALETTRDSVRV